MPHYSTCLEIILSVWDSSPEGNCTRASSHLVQNWEMGTVPPSAHPVLCLQGSVCVRAAWQASGSSFLAPNLHDEKWATVGKIYWHESLALKILTEV